MRILIDADGCPVIKQTIDTAKRYNTKVIIFCDTSHIINNDYAKTITVSKGADSVDFALVNQIIPDDIVITQDYGLAAMVLSKKGKAITQNGLIITDNNLNMLLTSRYENKKLRMSGKHTKGPKRRTADNDKAFVTALEKLITDK